ncbi:hypothetical protein EYF80_040115 [Liparis tanakae]|uniref:Uncharacterized protein n=1 Tax=Liparis tanakae TaxID=230148 RepID=A0A4Z2G9E7_9TELE|nr:hypothetical protein EYF80_040115 [Liparis tanakae]
MQPEARNVLRGSDETDRLQTAHTQNHESGTEKGSSDTSSFWRESVVRLPLFAIKGSLDTRQMFGEALCQAVETHRSSRTLGSRARMTRLMSLDPPHVSPAQDALPRGYGWIKGGEGTREDQGGSEADTTKPPRTRPPPRCFSSPAVRGADPLALGRTLKFSRHGLDDSQVDSLARQ